MESQIVLSPREYNAIVALAESAGSRKELEEKINKATLCIMKIARKEGKCIIKNSKKTMGAKGILGFGVREFCDNKKRHDRCRFYDACNYDKKTTRFEHDYRPWADRGQM